MRIKFFTALVFSLFGAAYTQAQIQYFKNYGLPNQNEWLIGIEPAAEPGQFWAAGLTRSVGQDDLLILKMDSIGQILWADTIGSPLHNELIFGFDRDETTGTMWISGSRTAFGQSAHTPLLIKLDADGNYALEKQTLRAKTRIMVSTVRWLCPMEVS